MNSTRILNPFFNPSSAQIFICSKQTLLFTICDNISNLRRIKPVKVMQLKDRLKSTRLTQFATQSHNFKTYKMRIISYFFKVALNLLVIAGVLCSFVLAATSIPRDSTTDPASQGVKIESVTSSPPGFWERLFSGNHKNQRAKPIKIYH